MYKRKTISYYNNKNNSLLGVVGGLVNKIYVIVPNKIINGYLCSADLKKTYKNFTSSEFKFHIGGFGNTYKEALKKCQGEIIERYALSIEMYNSDKIFNISRDEIIKKQKRVIPQEYIGYFSYSKINSNNPNDFVKLHNLKTSEDYYVESEAYLMCPEKITVDRFRVSTGAACHESKMKAIESAFFEVLQSDAYIYSWFTIGNNRKIQINEKIYKEMVKLGYDPNKYQVTFLDFSESSKIKIPVVCCIISSESNILPSISCGLGSDYDCTNAIIKSFKEALSFYYFNFLNYEEFKKIDVKIQKFMNLSDSALYYSRCNQTTKNKLFDRILTGSVDINDYEEEFTIKKFSHLYKNITSKLDYISIIDLTPTDIDVDGKYTFKVYTPELLQITLPMAPPDDHIRFKGKKLNNDIPNPLP